MTGCFKVYTCYNETYYDTLIGFRYIVAMNISMNNADLKNKYNPEGSNLRELQHRMLEILKEVDRICRKHNIQYWLSSGTLLGAIRHGGFIPWDDDLDIEMLRQDYLKLMDILPNELSKDMVLQTDMTDQNYVYLYAKVRDVNSYIKEECILNRKFAYQGAFIDIFQIEPSSSLISRTSAKLFNRLCISYAISHGCHTRLYKWFRALLVKGVFPFFRALAKLLKCKKLYHTYGVNFLTPRDADDIFPLSEAKFEGYLFSVPNNFDAYLTKMYGDYMSLPEKISCHRVDESIKIW